MHGIFTYSERVLTEGSSQEGGIQSSATSAEDGTQGYMLDYLTVSSSLLLTFYFEIKVSQCCLNHAGLEL